MMTKSVLSHILRVVPGCVRGQSILMIDIARLSNKFECQSVRAPPHSLHKQLFDEFSQNVIIVASLEELERVDL